MAQFIYVVRPTRVAMLREGPTAHEMAVLGQHFAYLAQLVQDGGALMAGRTLTDDDTTFGIAVLQQPTQEAADAAMRADPAVAQGVMTATLFPFSVALWGAEGPAAPPQAEVA